MKYYKVGGVWKPPQTAYLDQKGPVQADELQCGDEHLGWVITDCVSAK